MARKEPTRLDLEKELQYLERKLANAERLQLSKDKIMDLKDDIIRVRREIIKKDKSTSLNDANIYTDIDYRWISRLLNNTDYHK